MQWFHGTVLATDMCISACEHTEKGQRITLDFQRVFVGKGEASEGNWGTLFTVHKIYSIFSTVRNFILVLDVNCLSQQDGRK